MIGDRVGGASGNVLRTLEAWLYARRALFVFLFLLLLTILLFHEAFRTARGYFESHRVMQAALADVDNDGHLDAFLVNGYDVHPAYVLMNDGAGQTIEYDRQHTPAVGDVTGDGVTDIFLADTVRYRVWRGDRTGRFDPGRTLAYR